MVSLEQLIKNIKLKLTSKKFESTLSEFAKSCNINGHNVLSYRQICSNLNISVSFKDVYFKPQKFYHDINHILSLRKLTIIPDRPPENLSLNDIVFICPSFDIYADEDMSVLYNLTHRENKNILAYEYDHLLRANEKLANYAIMLRLFDAIFAIKPRLNYAQSQFIREFLQQRPLPKQSRIYFANKLKYLIEGYRYQIDLSEFEYKGQLNEQNTKLLIDTICQYCRLSNVNVSIDPNLPYYNQIILNLGYQKANSSFNNNLSNIKHPIDIDKIYSIEDQQFKDILYYKDKSIVFFSYIKKVADKFKFIPYFDNSKNDIINLSDFISSNGHISNSEYHKSLLYLLYFSQDIKLQDSILDSIFYKLMFYQEHIQYNLSKRNDFKNTNIIDILKYAKGYGDNNNIIVQYAKAYNLYSSIIYDYCLYLIDNDLFDLSIQNKLNPIYLLISQYSSKLDNLILNYIARHFTKPNIQSLPELLQNVIYIKIIKDYFKVQHSINISSYINIEYLFRAIIGYFKNKNEGFDISFTNEQEPLALEYKNSFDFNPKIKFKGIKLELYNIALDDFLKDTLTKKPAVTYYNKPLSGDIKSILQHPKIDKSVINKHYLSYISNLCVHLAKKDLKDYQLLFLEQLLELEFKYIHVHLFNKYTQKFNNNLLEYVFAKDPIINPLFDNLNPKSFIKDIFSIENYISVNNIDECFNYKYKTPSYFSLLGIIKKISIRHNFIYTDFNLILKVDKSIAYNNENFTLHKISSFENKELFYKNIEICQILIFILSLCKIKYDLYKDELENIITCDKENSLFILSSYAKALESIEFNHNNPLKKLISSLYLSKVNPSDFFIQEFFYFINNNDALISTLLDFLQKFADKYSIYSSLLNDICLLLNAQSLSLNKIKSLFKQEHKKSKANKGKESTINSPIMPLSKPVELDFSVIEKKKSESINIQDFISSLREDNDEEAIIAPIEQDIEDTTKDEAGDKNINDTLSKMPNEVVALINKLLELNVEQISIEQFTVLCAECEFMSNDLAIEMVNDASYELVDDYILDPDYDQSIIYIQLNIISDLLNR